MAPSTGTGGEHQVMIDINTTPLIDVMLVLLIMFILTIPIQNHATRINMGIPDPVGTPPKPPEIVRIDVDFDGAVTWNGEAIDAGAIEARLQAAAAKPEQPEIHVRPDMLVVYRHVATILAASQRVGLTRIGIVGNERFSRI